MKPIQPDGNRLIEQVDNLSEEVKSLAIDLAIYLAKVKADGKAEGLSRLEPDFMSLINGAVKVVKQLNAIIEVARDTTGAAPKPLIVSREPGSRDQLEIRLRSILDQCSRLELWLERTAQQGHQEQK